MKLGMMRCGARALACGMLLVGAGCFATTDAEYVRADPPSGYESGPHYDYDGQPVYYADGHWYRRRGSDWVYYRNEPAELQRRRQPVERAPDAYPHERGPRARESAPPARESAPPARRVD